MKVAISVGHNPSRSGAAIDSKTEYSETVIMAAFAIQHLQRHGHQAFLIGTGPLRKKIDQINALGVDCAVEFHLNQAGGVGHGCETLYCPGSAGGKSLAATIHELMVKATNNRDRGIKEGWYKMNPENGPDAFLAETNCPAVIVEPYFIDTEDEAFNGQSWIAEKIGIAVQRGLGKWKQGG